MFKFLDKKLHSSRIKTEDFIRLSEYRQVQYIKERDAQILAKFKILEDMLDKIKNKIGEK